MQILLTIYNPLSQLLGGRGHCHLKAKFCQSLHQAAFHVVFVENIEEVSAQLPMAFLVLEDLVGHYQEAVGDSDQGAFLAPPSRNPPELSGKVGEVSLLCAAAHAASHIVRRNHTSPLRVLPLIRFPALSLLPGHNAAQLVTWAEVGNCSMFTPSSATMLEAVVNPMPGNSIQRRMASSRGDGGSGASAGIPIDVQIADSQQPSYFLVALQMSMHALVGE